MLALDAEIQERLLGRVPADVLTAADRATLTGQRVLITGAGGTIGSELARQIAALRPAQLTILDHSEYALFRAESELRERNPGLALDAWLGDVSRGVDIRAACRAGRPQVVYHAAAYKHVPITERAIVPAARANILGTRETVRAARETGARFVLISSDKAAEPRSVMGASKRFAELIALSHATRAFRPVVVRFGNILGSSGSFLEVMWRAIEGRRNVPVTHPDATRFFMTVAEAVSLVLKTDLIGRRPEVFWLEMGQAVRIGDLAERFIDWAVAAGRPRVGIDVIGLRPGEKMREDLTNHGLKMCRTDHPRIWSARQRDVSAEAVAAAVRDVRRGAAAGDAVAILRAMHAAVPDFTSSPGAAAAAIAASTLAGRADATLTA